MASKASDFVARFVRLSREERAYEMLQDLRSMIMGIGSMGFEALVLMENKEAVACLLDLVLVTDVKEEYHLILGVLLKMSSIPSFAKTFGDGPATHSFLHFQRFLLPKVQAALRRRADWDSATVHTACLYMELLNNLMQHSPRFATEALNARVVHELLRSLPVPAQPSLSWADSLELAFLTYLVEHQSMMLVILQQTNPAGEKELRLDDLALLGDWLDRYLGYLDALSVPMLARGEGVRIGGAGGNLLRVIELVEGPERVNRVLFTKPRREALLRTADRLCALGGTYEAFGRQMARTVEHAGVVSEGGTAGELGKRGKKEEGARVSVAKAESLFDRLQTAERESVKCELLDELQSELRKEGWEASDTQRLAAKDCFPVLIDVVEKEHRKTDRKAGDTAGTFKGPVWPAVYILAALAEPFQEINNEENGAFCPELADCAPRLLRFARGAVNSLGLLELRMLLDALFAAYNLNPDEKWESRWPLLDVLLAANARYVAGCPGSFCVWHHFYDHLALIPEPSKDTRGVISLFRATPLAGPEKCASWAGLKQKMDDDVINGVATWGPDARKRKLAVAALDVLDEGANALLEPNSPIVYAAAALEFFCRSGGVVKDEVPGHIGPLMSCLGAAYAGMAGLVRTCEGRAADEEERWGIFGSVAANLTFCLQTVLASEPLAGAFLDALACNGGVTFAAEVLRTRGGAERYVWKNVPEEKNRAELLELLEELRGVAVRLWEGLSASYGLKKCSFPECPRDVLETSKNLFKRCAACGGVQYCSKECQASHWKKEHKKTCKRKDGT
ncbi:hypothetical protein KFL_009980030 [Klebsormidium nitens]|uniref:MYND-type domain-containing protein n=1 Tax=Klebsormidium nitens TaxID=105231 RepID=A0A1Y1IU73_KLENI|nr:hypothetical protein KFL_009980030 [Klebsormidium nitens]|eukprot:GAQ92376.1 hypothetical protein KFL_009980030 [Klebsormidium nitens]